MNGSANSDLSARKSAASPSLPPELEARIAALEGAAPPADFDAAGWFWIIVLGFAIPLALLVVGWSV